MKTIAYSSIADGDVLDFDPLHDVLWFDSAGVSAADLTLTVVGAGSGSQIGTASKTFTLDGAGFATLDSGNVVFANGSLLVNSSAGTLYANELAGGVGADLLLGGAATLPTTRASVSAAAVQGNGASTSACLSGDGRFVAFSSYAANLVGGDSNKDADVFVKDLLTGSVIRASTNALGAQGNSSSGVPSLSDDGRVVAFHSLAKNLVPGDSNGFYDVFVKDLATGTVTRASTSTAGAQGNSNSVDASLSADGRLVAFVSHASNLVDADTNNVNDIFVKSLATGTLFRVSTNSSGEQGNNDSDDASLSGDGRWVAFESYATNLAGVDSNAASDVFVKDTASGSVTRVSVGAGGVEANYWSENPSISADGRYCAFESGATNLVGPDTNGTVDVFVKDLWTGAAITRVSAAAEGTQANYASYDPTLSADGRFVSFTSNATNLVAGDTNGLPDIFVKDLVTGAITRVSIGPAGQQVGGTSLRPTISADGSTVAFDSSASNLVAGDSNGQQDVFATTNALESRTLSGGAGNDAYLISNARDTLTDSGGTDTVRAHITYVLPSTIERLELLGGANLNGTGNALNNLITGNAGDNLLDGANGVDTASYANAAAGVTVDLDLADAQATGGAGADTLLHFENLTGSAFDDALWGTADGNVLDGGAGNDLLVGGAGNDVYGVDRAGDQVIDESGIDTVQSTISMTLADGLENLVLLGTANLDATGNGLANVLYGNSGRNLLSGGAGTDTARFTNASAGVTVSLDKAGPQSTRGAGADTLISIENLFGGSYADTLHGNGGNNVLDGRGGVDTLSYARAGEAVTVSLANAANQDTGGAGVDKVLNFENLTGSAFADQLTGNTGANVVDGGAGADTMAGGDGNDTYVIDDADDVVTEVASGGTDTLRASVSRTLGAEQENLTLTGTGNFAATGNDLANVLTGNAGANVLTGGAGNDTANYADAASSVTVNLAGGLASGGGGGDSLFSIENVVGTAFGDTLAGSSVANVLTGGAGNDVLSGGAGNDTFVLNSTVGTDSIGDFTSAADHLRISQSALRVGNGNTAIDGAVTVAGPGGFAPTSELVVVTANIAGTITSANAAAAIGSASGAYSQGRTALFAVDNGSSAALWLFTSLDTNAGVSADELTLLATLGATAQTAVGDYLFGS